MTTDVSMKWCRACKQYRPISEFGSLHSSSDGKNPRCKECCRATARKHYHKDIDSSRRKMRERLGAKAAEIHKFLAEYLLAHPCIDCGESDIRVLVFDHIGNKESEISVMLKRYASIEKIANEIAECEVRCANCHRKRHAEEDDNWRVRALRGKYGWKER